MKAKIQKFVVILFFRGFSAATAGVGLAYLSSPHLHSNSPGWARVVDSRFLPADGIPRRYEMMVEQKDAWTRHPDRSVGRAFLIRNPETQEVNAFPWLSPFGTKLEFDSNAMQFTEPCWGMRYDPQGRCLNPPSHPGNIQRLEAKVHEGSVFINAKSMRYNLLP